MERREKGRGGEGRIGKKIRKKKEEEELTLHLIPEAPHTVHITSL